VVRDASSLPYRDARCASISRCDLKPTKGHFSVIAAQLLSIALFVSVARAQSRPPTCCPCELTLGFSIWLFGSSMFAGASQTCAKRMVAKGRCQGGESGAAAAARVSVETTWSNPHAHSTVRLFRRPVALRVRHPLLVACPGRAFPAVSSASRAGLLKPRGAAV
jgi:hypothetical protein